MASRDRAAEAETAARYRHEAALFKEDARRALAEGDEIDAHALNQSADDLIVLAASIERSIRGLPPLPPTSMEGAR